MLRSQGSCNGGVAEKIVQRRATLTRVAWVCDAGFRRHCGRFPCRRRHELSTTHTACFDGLHVDVVCCVADSVDAGSSIQFSNISTQSIVGPSAALTFGVFSKWHPNTRPIYLQGDKHFYAFTSPHSNTSQIVVWRRLGDVVAAGFGTLSNEAPVMVRLVDPKESLSCGRSKVGPIPDLYRRQGYDRNAWVFWESFWAPVWSTSGLTANHYVANRAQRYEQQWNVQSFAKGVDNSLNPWEGQGPNMKQASPAQDLRDRDSRSEAFELIYRKDVWPGILSKSGPGSDPFHPMVRLAITALDAVVDALDITSILDAACGDAGWVNAHFLSRRPQLRYVGVDIVAHVVEDNKRRYPSHTFMTVDLGDAAGNTPLPNVDLVFSKETLNHMFVQDAVQGLCRLRSTGAKFFLTNIARGAPNNRGALKMTHANYYPYDYGLPPFNLRKLASIIDINLDDWTEYALFSF